MTTTTTTEGQPKRISWLLLPGSAPLHLIKSHRFATPRRGSFISQSIRNIISIKLQYVLRGRLRSWEVFQHSCTPRFASVGRSASSETFQGISLNWRLQPWWFFYYYYEASKAIIQETPEECTAGNQKVYSYLMSLRRSLLIWNWKIIRTSLLAFR